MTVLNDILNNVRNVIPSSKCRSHIIDFHCTSIGQILDWGLGVKGFQDLKEFFFSLFEEVFEDTLHLLQILEFIPTIVKEKSRYFEVVEGDLITELFRLFLFVLLDLAEELIVYPFW